MLLTGRGARWWRGVILLLSLGGSVTASAGSAEMSIYVFIEQEPVAGIEVLVDGELATTTDDRGLALLMLEPGIRALQMRWQDRIVLDQPVLAHDSEISQWIVNVPRRGSTTLVDVESTEGAPVAADAAVETEPPVSGDPGTLTGQLISVDTGQPVPRARVFISGQSQDIQTDEQGRFSIDLAPGEYSVSVLHAAHNTLTRDGVVVQSRGTTELDFELTPTGSELPEFVVIEPYIAGSLASVLEERREEVAVANILGAEQISKAGDSDAASALRRVTGLTLVGGKFIYVRGLGERYSATLLNGANVPSPDATRRVVPLDLFPAGIIDSIAVQKGYTADLPGEFGGGTVQIRTKALPESSFFDVEASVEYNDQTTFKDGLTYAGGGRDWSGYDDGTRDQPDELVDAIGDGTKLVEFNRFTQVGFTKEELEEIGESLPVNYDVNTESIDPNFGVGLAGGNRWDLDDDWSIGFLAAMEYDNKWSTVSQIRRDYAASSSSDLTLRNSFVHDITVNEIGLSGFFTAGVEFQENHTLTFNYMLLRQTEDLARIEQGSDVDVEGGDVQFRELRWTEEQMLANQLVGSHIFSRTGGTKIDWQYTSATADTSEPDLRRYRYDPDDRSDEEDDFIFSLRNDSNVRSWQSLEDNSDNWNFDLFQPIPLPFLNNTDLAFQAGVMDVEKDRDFSIRKFAFKSRGSLSGDSDLRRNPSLDDIIFPDTIDPRGWQLDETTVATDAYTAEQQIDAKYVGLDANVGEWMRLSFGLRDETSDQSVVTFDPFSPDNAPIIADLSTDDRLPAFTATFFFGDHQVRANYGETVNRPDFKELSPALFRDPVLDRQVIGNPDLEPAFITHYDLRWDYYFNPGEFISLGAFYKEFDQPIESVAIPGAALLTSFDNAEAAENFGAEFELYKTLDFVDEWLEDWRGWEWTGFLERVYINTNYAWIDSEITIPPGSIQTNETRPLQGQSDFVWNFQVGYDDEERGINAALLYNIFGDRIIDVGISGAPDIIEQSRPVLDFVYAQDIGDNWRLKFRARNLLDPEVEILQGDEIWRQFTVGRTFTIGFEWSPDIGD